MSIAEVILDRMLAAPRGRRYAKVFDSAFILGSRERRVTLYDQQRRALNLVWALFKTGKLATGQSVAILGGGLAGLTASIAACSKGCHVQLFERRSKLLETFAGCSTRFVHPNLLSWPSDGWNISATDLPFLNWEASTAETVAEQLRRQWSCISASAPFTTYLKVHPDLAPTVHRSGTLLDSNGTTLLDPATKRRYLPDAIIFAVGFGREYQIKRVPSQSYWEVDSFHQDPVSGNRRSFLISGAGDGALADVLRATLTDAAHAVLAKALEGQDFRAIQSHLLMSEAAASKLSTDDEIATFLWEAYNRLPMNGDLLSKMHTFSKRPTQVVLCTPYVNPFTLRSSILHRLLVALLLMIGRITHISHRLDDKQLKYREGKYHFSYPGGEGIEFTDIAVRHGPEKALAGVLPFVLEPAIGTDLTREQNWEAEFFPRLSTPACATVATSVTLPIMASVSEMKTSVTERTYQPFTYHCADTRLASDLVAAMLLQTIRDNPEPNVILPTGRTARLVFESMCRLAERGECIDFFNTRFFSDTETFGVAPSHISSRQSALRRVFIEALRSHGARMPNDDRIHFVPGVFDGPDSPINTDLLLERHTPHIELVALSPRGEMIGFEPDKHTDMALLITSFCGVVDLSSWSRNYIDPKQPSQVIVSIGIGNLLRARAIVVLLCGREKEIVAERILTQMPIAQFPPSVLRLHPRVAVVTDHDAWPTTQKPTLVVATDEAISGAVKHWSQV